jgi:pilus assembly protein CpaB
MIARRDQPVRPEKRNTMSRRVLLIGTTLLLAVVGAVAVLLYVGRADARALAGKQVVTVLVAAKKVPLGTSARHADSDGLFRKAEMPKETVPSDALSEVGSDLADLVTSADIQPGQLVLRPMFVTEAQRPGGLAIPDGKIAVSVALGAPQRVAGYVQVGSKIAIFDTFNVAEGQGRTSAGDPLSQRQHKYNQATRVVLASVEVIALGPKTPDAGKDGDSTKQSGALASQTAGTASDIVLVTVAVDQAEAEKLVHTAQTGALYLALLTDTSTTSAGEGVDNRTVFGR